VIRIDVKVGVGYGVEIGHGLLPTVGERLRALCPRAKCAAVVTDTNVAPLYLETLTESLEAQGFSPLSFTIPAGELSKNGSTYLALLEFLAQEQVTRSDVLLALGGGVVGDLCGFAAATYLRGVDYVQIPTTLLAAVDSSVGGKTAIDLAAGKNLAGAFYQPAAVYCDLDTFVTLPDAVFADGCAEMIKYGMLGSTTLLDRMAREDFHEQLEALVAHCVGMKRDLVERDERDHGDRQRLNLGHTIGHAIEACSEYAVSHGQSVAIGMAIITRAAVRRGLCPVEAMEILDALLLRFDLPNQTNYPAEALYAAALGDKKRQGDVLTIIVPRALGKSERMTIPVEELLAWIEEGYQP